MKPVFAVPTAPTPSSFQTGKESSFLSSLAAQQTASTALPSIISPPAPNRVEIGPQGSSFQQVIIPANAILPVQVRGDYVYIEGVTFDSAYLQNQSQRGSSIYSEVLIKPDTLNTQWNCIEPNWEIRFPIPFNFLQVQNATNLPVIISLWIGFGGVRRDRARRIVECAVQDNYIGPGTVVNKDEVMNRTAVPYVFQSAASPYFQRATIKSVRFDLNNAPAAPFNFSLFLYSLYPGFVWSFKTPYVHLVNLDFNYYLGRVDFVSDYHNSNGPCATSENHDLNIPIYARPVSTIAPGISYAFTVFGILVTRQNQSLSGNSYWYTTLTLEQP